MRKVLLLSVVLVFCAALGLASAGDKGGATEATISKLDMSSKSMVVKSATTGQEMTIHWNEATQLEGVLKEGETIHVKTSEKDGKTWATWVHVGEMKNK